jgi:hypothetical protein
VKAAILSREKPARRRVVFYRWRRHQSDRDSLNREVHLLSLTQDHLAGFDASTSNRIGRISPRGPGIYISFLANGGYVTQPPPVSAVETDDFIAYANDFDHKAFIAEMKKLR